MKNVQKQKRANKSLPFFFRDEFKVSFVIIFISVALLITTFTFDIVPPILNRGIQPATFPKALLVLIIVMTLMIYYFVEIIAMGRGWAWIIDTFPLFLAAFMGGILLIITYTSIGLGLSSVSRGKFFPGIGLVAIVLGTKTLAVLVSNLFERDIMYLLSPYDCLAHVGQALIGTQTTYDQYSWTWSFASLVLMNAFFLYILSSRVASMEVTRE